MNNKKKLCMILSGCMVCMLSASSTVLAEEDSRPVYPATFTASGTDADTYNAGVKGLIDYFEDYYAATGELDKVTGYDETITFSTVGWFDSTTQDAYAQFETMYGETLSLNRWLDAYKQIFNAQGEAKWYAQDAEYNQKLRLDMAASDLPDIFLVREQSDVIELAEAGVIWDMKELIEEYAVEELKTIWDSDGGIALAKVTDSGRVYGLPAKLPDTDNFSYLWIRSDWLEQVGMEHPTTVEELEAVMEAFVNADFDGNGEKDTVGILLDKDIYYSSRGLFNSFGAYPEIWVEDDGVVSWGGISEENKDVLSCLADWYQKGYISQEFITQDNTAALENVMSGKCGIVYGGHWFGFNMQDLHELDPNSDWVSIDLPKVDDKEVFAPLVSGVNGWVVVNSEFKHPELALKMLAMMRVAYNCPTAQWWMFDKNVSWHVSPVRSTISAMDNLFTYQKLMEVYEKNTSSELVGKPLVYWGNLHGDSAWAWEHMFGPLEYTPMKVLEEFYENDRLFYDAFYGVPSSYMQERWSTIKDEQLIAFTKMIAGEISVEEGFAQWIENFKSLGGDQITQEVNDWFGSK